MGNYFVFKRMVGYTDFPQQTIFRTWWYTRSIQPYSTRGEAEAYCDRVRRHDQQEKANYAEHVRTDIVDQHILHDGDPLYATHRASIKNMLADYERHTFEIVYADSLDEAADSIGAVQVEKHET